MPSPSRKTPHRIARMFEMHGQGASTREIGDELKVSHTAIVGWLADSGLSPNGGNGKRNGRRRVPPGGADGALTAAQKALADLASTPAPADLDEVLERLRENYGLVCALVEFHVKGARAGTSTMAELDKAISIQERFAVQISELTPHEAANAENDPTNLEAAAAVRAEIESLADVAERSVQCAHCGKNPFR